MATNTVSSKEPSVPSKLLSPSTSSSSSAEIMLEDSNIGAVPANLQHLYDNPHVLFPEPLIACFARRDNWAIKTIESSNDYVEIILTLQPRSSLWSISSSPSSTTTTDTVTTSSSSSSSSPSLSKDAPIPLPSPLFFYFKRFIVAGLFGLLIFSFWFPPSFHSFTMDNLLTIPLYTLLYDILLRCVLAYGISLLLVHPQVIQESVAAIRGLGLQITTVYENGKKDTTFIDSYSIRSIIVNEGIRSCNIIYYLAVIAAGRRTMLLLYEYARPRLPVIAYIYSKLVRVLNE